MLYPANKACDYLKTAMDLEYNWIIDSCLIRNCPDVNIDREIHLMEYKGNVSELGARSFISLNKEFERMDELVENDSIEMNDFEESRNFGSSFQNSINIYPNPSRGQVQIVTNSGLSEKIWLKVYSSAGVLVKSVSFNQQHLELNLEELNSGLYILIFTTDERVVSSKKLKIIN